MTRRSFLFLALIFALILSVSSVAFAGEVYSCTNGDVTVELSGSDTFNNKVDWPFYENGKFVFIINSPINSNDAFYGNGDFGVQIKVAKPDNASITKYSITESGPEGDFTVGPYQIGTKNCADQYKKGINISELSPWQQYTRTFDFTINWKDNNDNNVGEPVAYSIDLIIDYRPTTKVTAVEYGTVSFAHSSLWGGSTFSSGSKVSYVCNYDNIIYMINELLTDSDWQKDGDTNYLSLDTALSVPEGAKYYKNNGANNPEIKEIPTTPSGSVDDRVWDGCRIDEPDFSNGDIRHTYSYTWYDAEQKELSTTQYEIEVKYTAFPTPVREGKITPDYDVPSEVSRGAVRYTVSGVNTLAFDTVVKKPRDRVAAYSLKGDSIRTLGDSDSITISTAESGKFIISWYDDNNGLVCTEYIDIVIENFTPASEFTYINHDYFTNSTKEGVLGNKPVISDGTNRQGISVTYLTYNLDLSQMELQKLLYYHGDGETLAAPYRVNLPSTAVKKYSFGTAADMPKNEVMESLGIMDYEICDGNNNGIQHLIEMGYSTADGSSVIITPQGGERAQLIKWIDADGKEYYHMIVFVFNFASDNSYRVEAINPSVERVKFNVYSHPAIKDDPRPSYVNGVVTYTAGPREDGAPESVCTAIDKPFDDVTDVTVYSQWGNSYGYDFTQSDQPQRCIIESFVPNGSVESEVYQLEWTRENGSSKYLELITVYVIPDGDTWMEEHWVPAAAGRTQPITDQSDVLADHLSYDADTGRWLFDIHAASNPNLDDEAFGYPVFMITPPEGATHYTVALWGSPIYSDHLAESIENQLQSDFDNKRLNPIEDDTNSLIWYDKELKKLCYTPCGKLLTRTALADTDGMSIYTVNATMPGHAQIAVFEWFKSDGEDGYDQIMFDGNKRGEFVYCEKNPYLNVKVTDIKDAITAPVTEPTAVVLESTSTSLTGHKLRCEIPLQKNAGKNYWYKYYKLDLVDENGNVVELPAGSKIKVYIPYPEGTDMNSKIQHFDVWHYHDENHGSHDSMRNDGVLKLEEYGITFETTSFSPFLVSYKAEDANDDGNGGSSNGNNSSSSGGSGISITYNGGNSFSTSNSAVPTSVEIDGIPVSFTGDGRSFTVSGIPAGAKWITVRWNSTSITTNFAPDGNVVSAGIEIPKTGDISLLMPVLALIGAAAARCRRSSK